MNVLTRKFCEATKVAEIHRRVYDFDLDVCDMTFHICDLTAHMMHSYVRLDSLTCET